MMLEHCDIHVNDTGIFVYEPSAIKSREPNTDSFYENVGHRVNLLKDTLNINFGLQFEQMDYGPEIVFLDDPTEGDFIQFCFHLCNTKQGIYVDRLMLPPRLSGKGISTFCVKWLKDFAEDLGFKYIILGSIVEARAFWTEMGFRLLSLDELPNYPGYQGRYNK